MTDEADDLELGASPADEADSPSSRGDAPRAGTQIGDKYRIVRTLARGGMGWLVEAEHLLLHRPVAIKLLRADRRASSRGRFLREARATRALTSEHVVRVFDLGLHEGEPYIVMELLQGVDLEQLVADRGPLPVEEAVDYVLEACVAVVEAHELGIIHRDLKPANLFSTRVGQTPLIKVLDFGISKVADRDEEDDPDATAENAMLGTPHYMPPEQLRNPTKIDERADVWALAVTLFHLLTGEHPFSGTTSREVAAAVFTETPRRLGEALANVPEELAQTVERALAKRPAERIPSVATLARRLAPFGSERASRALQRIAPESESDAPVAAVADVARSHTTTEAGVATNTESKSTTAPAQDERRWRRFGWVVAASACVGLIVWGLSGGEDSIEGNPDRRELGAESAGPPAPAPKPAPATTAPSLELEPGPSPAVSESSSRAAPPRPAAADTKGPLRVRVAPNGSDSGLPNPDPTSTPSAPPALDIDGVPIVE